jgi:hypothetical protein
MQKHVTIQYTYFPYVFFAILYTALDLYPFTAHECHCAFKYDFSLYLISVPYIEKCLQTKALDFTEVYFRYHDIFLYSYLFQRKWRENA